MIQSFLMIGQSNMAGRGYLKDVPQLFDEHIYMLRNGLWQVMVEPINVDRPGAGVGLASSFAAAWRRDHPQEEIGLIPCAEGGSSLEDWAVHGILFDHAVGQARLAQRTSEIKGVLWHQGENDCAADKASVYGQKLSVIIEALRKALDIPEVPLMVGGLGNYLSEGMFGPYFSAYPLVNEALEHFAELHANSYFVTAQGLRANPDGIHFDAVSQRRLGLRYYQAYRERSHVLTPLADEENVLAALYARPYTQTEKMKLLEHEFASGNISLEAYARQREALTLTPES